MERLVLLSALFVTLVEVCVAAGAYAHQNPSGVKQNRVNGLNTVQQEFGQLEQGQYAANLETIMQLLAERDAQEAEWRRNEAIERENLLNELAVQKRDFRYYGSRGKRPSFDYQKRFQYFPSRG